MQPGHVYIHANMDYMCFFHSPPPSAPHLTSELQFHLANFQAALSVCTRFYRGISVTIDRYLSMVLGCLLCFQIFFSGHFVIAL
jgi:hypothetical protein